MPPSLHPAHPSGWPSCSARPNNGGCGPGRAAAALRNWYDAGPGEDLLPVRQDIDGRYHWAERARRPAPCAPGRRRAHRLAVRGRGRPSGREDPLSGPSRVDPRLSTVPTGVQLAVTGDKRDAEAFSQSQICRATAGALGAQGPLCGQQRAPPVARDREIGTGTASLPGAVEAQGPATDQAAQGGQHLDVEKMGHRELPLELPPETGAGSPPTSCPATADASTTITGGSPARHRRSEPSTGHDPGAFWPLRPAPPPAPPPPWPAPGAPGRRR